MADNKEINEACDNNDSLESFKVCQLKNYLREHGQNVSGKKSDLILRVKGVRKLGLKDLNSVDAEDRQVQKHRDNNKLKTSIGECLPHPNTLKGWSTSFLNVPEFYERDIYNYFVLKMNTKLQEKSKIFYSDRHVYNVEINEMDDEYSHFYIKCKVIPSLPTDNKSKQPDHNVWVMISKVTGNVNSAECGCTAGEGESCNHIAALMYCIVDISTKKRDGKLAATSEKCKWNNPRKRKLSPKKAQDIKFRRQIWVAEKENQEKDLPRPTKPVLKLKTDVGRFRERLVNSKSKAGWLKNFTSSVAVSENEFQRLPSIHNIPFNYINSENVCTSSYLEGFKDYFQSITISAEDCVRIEVLTRNQSDSLFWKAARAERITASNFGKVAKMKPSTPPDSILKDLMDYRTFDSNYLKWGRNHEAAARRTYINKMKKEHPSIVVKQCGLVTDIDYPHLGSSPDGLVHCGHCTDSSGVLEIKCPASDNWRMLTPEKCAEDPKFFCQLNDSGDVVLKRHHSYYYQVQGQMAMCRRKWCDFVVWTCTGKISVERIAFDEQFWMATVEKLNDFYLKAFIPELFCRRVQRDQPLHQNCRCYSKI